MICTIYKNVYDFKNPHKIKVEECLNRIKTGKSSPTIQKLRDEKDAERQNEIKKNLPSIVFSGLFTARRDDSIQSYTNLIVLDFDDVKNVNEYKVHLSEKPFVYAAWVSPRGNGIKALIKIADGKKHLQHFLALEKEFEGVDPSGKNLSRVCYESYDPEIYINENAEVYGKILQEEVRTEKIVSTDTSDNYTQYENLKTWLNNKQVAFESGNRNFYIFKLASACCRLGIDQNDALSYLLNDFSRTDFSQKEITLAVKSAYRSNTFGSSSFEKNELVTTVTQKIVDIAEIEQNFEEFSHIIFGDTVKSAAMDIYDKGYQKLNGINAPVFDRMFKSKRGEVTLWTGFGNMGKSTKLKWFLLNRAVLFGEKYALFDPEANPAEESYIEFAEMLAGCDCTPSNPDRPSREKYQEYYDFVSNHFFYVYPEKIKPTMVNLKESFLELIIKHGVDGIVIDPFNQVFHDRGKIQREDFYLEEVLSDISKFTAVNDVFCHIVAHPTGNPERVGDDFKAPDMYKVSGGSMWANKMHNIVIYHRPFSRSQPDNPEYNFITDKIKKKKITGKTGSITAHYFLKTRRFVMPFFDTLTNEEDMSRCYDPLANNIKKAGLFQDVKITEFKEMETEHEQEPKPLPMMTVHSAFDVPQSSVEDEDSWLDSFDY